MDDHPTIPARQAFAERLARIRRDHPGWDIHSTPARQVGWIARRGGDKLWAVTLTELERVLSEQDTPEREPAPPQLPPPSVAPRSAD